MARLKGPLKLEGTLDGLSFYQTQDGIIVRRKWGPDRKRMKNDPSFEGARKHGLEFGSCAKDSSLLRRSLRPFLKNASDNRLTSRANKLMLEIMKLDTRSKKGERRVAIGIFDTNADALLQGFEFNIHCPLKEALKKIPRLDESNRLLEFITFSPKKDLVFPKGATHAELKAGLLRIDFDKRAFSVEETNSVLVDRKKKEQTIILQWSRKMKGPGKDLFVLNLLFFKDVGGKQEMLEKNMNACAIIRLNV